MKANLYECGPRWFIQLENVDGFRAHRWLDSEGECLEYCMMLKVSANYVEPVNRIEALERGER